MNKLLLAVLLVFIVTQADANIYKTVPTGFKNLEWGDAPNKLKEKGIPDIEGYTESYMYIKQHIGDIPVASITYTFNFGKFDKVDIVIDTLKNCRSIKDVLINLYGVEPYRPNQYVDRYMWFNNYEGDITTVFLYLPTMDTCIVQIENSLLNKSKREKAAQEKINNAKGDM